MERRAATSSAAYGVSGVWARVYAVSREARYGGGVGAEGASAAAKIGRHMLTTKNATAIARHQ